MGVIAKVLRYDDAVYQGPIVKDGAGGGTYPAPIEFLRPTGVRWDAKIGKVPNPFSDDRESASVIMVPQDVEVGGWLYHSTMANLPGGGSTPLEEIPGAVQIIGFRKTPNFKNTETLREAFV